MVTTSPRSRCQPLASRTSSPTTASGKAAGCVFSYDVRTRLASFPALSLTK